MRIPVTRIIKIELKKFIKRSDMIVIFGLVVIAFFYTINIENSIGTETGQSVLYWLANQMMLINALFIGPVIMSYIGAQFLAAEIDNGSVMLFEEKIRNRTKTYIGKNIAMIIVSTGLFVISGLIMFALYLYLIAKDSSFVSGIVVGKNEAELILLLIFIYSYTFFFIPQISFFLGTRFKPLPAIIICTGVVLLCNYALTFVPFKYINPYWGVMCITDMMLGDKSTFLKENMEVWQYGLMQAVLIFGYYAVLLFVGVRNFRKKDIQ